MIRSETVRWLPHVLVEKFDPEAVDVVARRSGIVEPSGNLITAHGVKPFETVELDGNLLTTAGLGRLTSLLTGGGGQALTNTSVRLGVGDGTTAAAVGDTDLSAAAGSTHRLFKVMDASYPSVAGAVVTFKSTFGTSDANFQWNEWGLDVGAPTVTDGATVNALLFNHKTSAALGTKASGSWALTVTVTFS